MKNIDLIDHKKILSYTLWQYLSKIFLIILTLYAFLFLFGDNSNQYASLISSSFIFLLITVFATKILLKENKWNIFFIVAYISKIFIGVGHYIFFIDSNYFEGQGHYKALTYEFESVYLAITNFASLKLEQGLFYFDAESTLATHPEILSLISIPFMFLGDFVLTISPINTFFSLLTSINIILISKYKYNFSDEKLKHIAIATAYFPITLITSLLWRDVIGFSLMSIGITMIILSRRSLTQYFVLICAGYLFYLQRTVYPILLVLAFGTNIVFNKNFRTSNIQKIYRYITIIIICFSIPEIYNLANTESNIALARGMFNLNPIFLPFKFIIGLIGPFPWTNFLLYELFPANAYQLQDFLQGTFNISFVIVMFKNKFFVRKNLNLLNIIGIFLVASGLLNEYMHMPYLSFGLIFLIPWMFNAIKLSKFITIYIRVFIALIALNIVIINIIGNLGLSNLWR